MKEEALLSFAEVIEVKEEAASNKKEVETQEEDFLFLPAK